MACTAQTRCTAVRRVNNLPSSSSPSSGTADSKVSDPHVSPPPSSHKITYSLSSQPPIPPPSSSSRSTRRKSRSRAISSSPICTSSFMSSPPSHVSSLWDEDSDSDDLHLSPIHPLDQLKTLLSQLAATISELKTAHAHQQEAFNPFNMQCAVCEESSGAVAVPATDKIMTEGLERLSYLHTQLSRLPHLQLFAAAEGDDGSTNIATEGIAAGILLDGEDQKKKDSMMLKRYEGIITRFHEEIERKEAVTAVLKETLASSMLQGEKLERRLKALEALRRDQRPKIIE